MKNKFLILNIREYLKLGKDGEKILKQCFSSFSCTKNLDVEKFLLQQSIEFTKKNQSVTYLVISPNENKIAGYFTITIKPIVVHTGQFSNNIQRKIARVSGQDAKTGDYYLSAYLIAQLGKNYKDFANKLISGKELLELAIEKIKELQYMAGGMVVFLESENTKKLLDFYEVQNQFKRFDVRQIQQGTENEHTLIQFLKVL